MDTTALLVWLGAAGLAYLGFGIFYNAFLHPLAAFPGPFRWRVSRIPFSLESLRGTALYSNQQLHEQYGEVVRVSPNELSFAAVSAWKDVYARRPEMEKDRHFYLTTIKDAPINIVTTDAKSNKVLRRHMAPAFTDRGLKTQQDMMTKYTDLLIQRLQEHGDDGKKPVDLVAWFNYTTFDAIGDLLFAEPFGSLENSEYHPWVRTMLNIGRLANIQRWLAPHPWLLVIMGLLVPPKVKRAFEEDAAFTKRKLQRRIEMADGRPDLIQGFIESGMDSKGLEANVAIIALAGSESSATSLSGAANFLMSQPHTLQRLTAEVRSAFREEGEINFQSVANLKYLSACVDETLRLYPPVAGGLPRVVPKGGATIAGRFVAEDCVVSVSPWATSRSPAYFKDPSSFHPERWLRETGFADDVLEATQPFQLGARSCIGRNLALAEMRVILARLVWNFDLKPADRDRDWMDQKSFFFWEKGPLLTYLHPINR